MLEFLCTSYFHDNLESSQIHFNLKNAVFILLGWIFYSCIIPHF